MTSQREQERTAINEMCPCVTRRDSYLVFIWWGEKPHLSPLWKTLKDVKDKYLWRRFRHAVPTTSARRLRYGVGVSNERMRDLIRAWQVPTENSGSARPYLTWTRRTERTTTLVSFQTKNQQTSVVVRPGWTQDKWNKKWWTCRVKTKLALPLAIRGKTNIVSR